MLTRHEGAHYAAGCVLQRHMRWVAAHDRQQRGRERLAFQHTHQLRARAGVRRAGQPDKQHAEVAEELSQQLRVARVRAERGHHRIQQRPRGVAHAGGGGVNVRPRSEQALQRRQAGAQCC